MAMFHVYDAPKPDGYYSTEPDAIYRTLLDADWIIYILLPLLFILVVWLMVVAWRIHEIPAHRADHKKMRQVELVSALTLLGLFMHWVWAVALFFAYFDWEHLENAIVRILRKARIDDNVSEAQPVAAQPPAAPTPPPANKPKEADA